MADEFKNIDKIIRQKFENFEPEPPMEVWDKIRSGIKEDPPAPSSSTGIILPIIITISILIFISGLIHYYYPGNSESVNQEPAGLTIQAAGVVSTGSTTISDASLQQEFYTTPSELHTPQVTAASDEREITTTAPVEKAPKKDKNKKATAKTNNNPGESSAHHEQGKWKPGLVQAVKSGQLTLADAERFNLNTREFRKLSAFTDDYARRNKSEWSLGMYFNPEVTSSQDAGIENSTSYNFGIMPRVSFNHFFIQSGVNMRMTHDKGNLAVDYNRFLGTYEYVDYMTFDSVNGVIVPTYHTHTEEVFDTVNHYAVSDTKVNYTYLEIPLYFGYRYAFGKFGVFGKIGPAASFLVISKQPVAVDPEENARIVNINYLVPARYDLNWQLVMGAGFDYQLAKKFNVSLEPTFRLGLKPEYKSAEGYKYNTLSFGVRLGLNYNF